MSQRTGGHAGRDAFSPQCRPLLRRRGALSMRCLLRAIPTDGHAAPSSSMATSAIDKEKRAGGTLACLHLRQILPTDQVSHGARDWEQQGIRRAPAPLESAREL